MNFYDVIHNHRSIRKYLPDSVPADVLDRILGAALKASSSGNMQAYSIIVTSDEGLKRELFPLHFDQTMVLEAPLLLTFCADFHRMRKWLEISGAPDNFDNFMSFMIGAIDAVLAAQNAALAAEAEGLGICFMGTTLANCLDIGRILKCPENVVPVVGFSLGYSAEAPPSRDRLPISGIVHRETYQEYRPEQIKAVYHDRENAGMKRYRAIPELNQLIEESGAENLAQIYTRVKYTRESHIEYSQTVLRALALADFLNNG